MNTASRPKQFLEYQGKPIIIYTLELFDNHPDIDGIVVACVESWIPFLEKMLKKFEINKVRKIVPGGETGQDSIYQGLVAAKSISKGNNDIVLIHDGVRPLITAQTISDNIAKVQEEGSCITCIPATETFVVCQPDGSLKIPSRADSLIARAPQSFYLKDILEAHEKIRMRPEGYENMVDAATIIRTLGGKTHLVMGNRGNLKITTPEDVYTFRAFLQYKEDKETFGLGL